MEQPHNNNIGYIITGVILIALGVIWTIAQFLGANVLAFLWPGFIILPGVLMFVGMFLGGKQAGGLAIPATIVTTLGLVLFYQNLFNQWWTWSFIWALVGPVATGLGILIFSFYSDKPEARKGGLIVLVIGLVLLAVFGFSFGLSRLGLARYIVPLALIGLGIYLVIQRSRSVSAGQAAGSDDESVGQ